MLMKGVGSMSRFISDNLTVMRSETVDGASRLRQSVLIRLDNEKFLPNLAVCMGKTSIISTRPKTFPMSKDSL